MGTKLRIMLALAAAAAPLSAALAADYDPPIYVDEAPEYAPVEVGSGWYLRGDVAYLANKTYRDFDFHSTADTLSEHEDPVFGSVGFGYHFNDYVRGDVNIGVLPGNKAKVSTDDIISARIKNSAGTAIVNGYVDLGTYVGITPYLGAGIGAFRSKYHASAYMDDDLLDKSERKTRYSFAYTLNAGLGYQISKNLLLDLGYQYMSAPDAEYARLDGIDGYTVRKGVDSHQVKVGLRYDLW